MKKLLIGDKYNYIVTSNMLSREFIQGYELTEKQLNDQYTEEDIFINNGGLTALSGITRFPVDIDIISDYINNLGSFDGLTVLPSYCSTYDILAINRSCDGYIIFTVKTIDK